MRSRDAQKRMAAANPVDREPSSTPLSPPEEELLEMVLADRGAAEADLNVTTGSTRPAWRRAPRLAVGGTVALAAVGAALIVSAGGSNTPAAYAVEAQPGGGVKIKIYNLGDPEGVEKALEEAGVASQVTFLEAGKTCREPHYQPSMAMLHTLTGGHQPQPWAGFDYESSEGPLTIAIGDYQQRLAMNEEINEALRNGDDSVAAGAPSFVVDPSGFKPGQTLVMSSAPTPAGYQQPVPPSQDGIKISHLGPPVDTVGQVRVAEGEVGPCVPVAASEEIPTVRAPKGGWDFSGTEYAGWGFGSGPGGSE